MYCQMGVTSSFQWMGHQPSVLYVVSYIQLWGGREGGGQGKRRVRILASAKSRALLSICPFP